MEQKLIQCCETKVDGDACKASYLFWRGGAVKLLKGKAHLLTDLMNPKAVCRTAPCFAWVC